MEEGVIPHGNNSNIEEERRLCYVGFTRAMKSLTLTGCATRRRYGEIETQAPSPFLEDIPDDYLHLENNIPQEVTQDEAVDYFSEMKKLLAD